MLKYKCLVLDHDDTVVQSEKTMAYPCFCETLAIYRPGASITFSEYVHGCHHFGFVNMCREWFAFTEQELKDEYAYWMEYAKTHIPEPFPGIEAVIKRQKQEGGLVCVVSHSSIQNISRDYDVHFGMQPDAIYGWDLPEEHRKPSPWALQDIMARHCLSPKDLLVVDDMKLACQMAQPVGVQTAFAVWGKQEFPELSLEMRALCDFAFDSPQELGKFLFD